MRIVLPVFARSNTENLKFLDMPWGKTSVFKAALANIKKTSPARIIVASNNGAILADAERAKVETVPIKRLTRPAETFLPLGTISTLREIGPSPKQRTLVLWPGVPWFAAYCYNFFKEFKFSSQKKMALTVRKSRAHPAQMYEGLNLLGTSTFLPLALSADKQFYLTEVFPFDWTLRKGIDDGPFFLRHTQGEKVVYKSTTPDNPLIWREGVIEKVSSEEARFICPKIGNITTFRATEGDKAFLPFSYAPPWSGDLASQIIFLRQPETNKLYLAVNFNKLPQAKNLSVKIWLKDKDQLHPWVQNGIPLQRSKGIKLRDDKLRKDIEAFALPDLPFTPTLFLVWLVSCPGSRGGKVSFQLPWRPDGITWEINGRQDFSPVYEPDGLGTLLAPGFHLTNEPMLQAAAVEYVVCDDLFPLPIRDIVGLLRAEYQTERLRRI